MSVSTAPPRPHSHIKAEPQSGGLIASFVSVPSVIAAVKELRSRGYQRIDVHSPHPIHGVDEALGLKGSPLPWGAIVGALTGLGGGVWMAWWMNAIDYQFIISGKPLFSILPSVPVAFELAILLAAFAVFGLAILCGGMPRFSDPKFRLPPFARSTNDRYVLAIDARDQQFDAEITQELLQTLGGHDVTEIPPTRPEERTVPRAVAMSAAVLGVVALIPPVLIAKARSTTSTRPRISFVSDMDHQPKFKAQTTSTLFADGRSMRPQVPGTIARGDLREDDRYYLGKHAIAAVPPGQAAAPPLPPADTGRDDIQAASDPNQWVTHFPLSVDEAFIRRGQQRYEIFCATCHGAAGDGDGLVTLRAMELEQGTWVKPPSLHSQPLRDQPVGQIFHAISNGVRKMPGYASQIPVKDRWAIVAYLRALQRTRTASSADVPEDVLPRMRDLN